MSPVVLLASGVLLLIAFSAAQSAATPISEEEFFAAKVHTDGHFRPGGFETIHVRKFPGPGRVEVAFFPSAICEDECGAVSRFGGRTDMHGRGIFHVRVPGYFFDAEGHKTYFLNRERIDLQVMWMGHEKDEFAVGTPRRKPVIVRPRPADQSP